MSAISLLELLARLGAAAEDAAAETVVRVAARMLCDSAKASIGTYDFGWPELADSTKEDRVKKGFSENDPPERTGALKELIQYNADHREAYVGTDNETAAFAEFGTVHEPPRSYLGGAIAYEAKAIESMAAAIAGAAIGAALGGGSELVELLHIGKETAQEVLHEARDTAEGDE